MTIHATFAGRQLIRTASFTLTQGTTPSTGTITALGWDAFPSTGYLHLGDSNITLRIGPLYVTETRNIEGKEGKICIAVVADSRVLWKFGFACGVYNQPDKSGQVETKTFRELVEIILDSPGHQHSIIWPRNVYQILPPAVSWEGTAPANALQELCDRYGLSVGFDIANQVYIAPINIKRNWPNTPPIQRGGNYSLGPYPSHVLILGSRIIDEIWFYNLVPVGLELDGTIKEIDELSYKPAGVNWGLAAVNDFMNIDAKYRAVAKKCIYKWYQWRYTKSQWPDQNQGTLRPLTVEQRRMYLPWLSEISTIVTQDGVTEHGQPYVHLTNAYYYDGTVWVPTGEETARDGFTIDGNRAIVMFERITAVYVPSTRPDAQEFQPAEVSVRASFELNSNSINDYYQYYRAVGWRGIPEKVHREPSLVLYRINGIDQTNVVRTVGGIKYIGDLDSYAKEIAEVYRIGVFADRRGTKGGTWPGLLHYACYGEMRSITWTVSKAGATTDISGGSEEVSLMLPPYEERVLMQRASGTRWNVANLPPAPSAGRAF